MSDLNLPAPLSRLFETSRAAWFRVSAPQRWTDADFDALIEVDPQEIVHYQDVSEWRHRRLVRYAPEEGVDSRRFVAANRGKVVDGEWDLVRTPFGENAIYRLLHEHFVGGVPWEQTAVFRQFADEIAAGERRWHWSSSTEEMLEAAREVENLFRSMEAHGYRQNGSADAITVSIGRGGELLYNNVGGHHRLSIAKIQRLESVPVRVLLRHRSWQDVRDRVRRVSDLRELHRSEVDLLRHPDLVRLITAPG